MGILYSSCPVYRNNEVTLIFLFRPSFLLVDVICGGLFGLNYLVKRYHLFSGIEINEYGYK
jgi:hypothetical protein